MTASRWRVRVASWQEDGAALRAIREQVFVVEQSVPLALEWDEFDESSRHVLAEASASPIGTGRLLPDGHIGRMAVLRAWRGHGVGSEILRALVGMARDAGHQQAMLNAQVQALQFYRRFGFEAQGREFLEAGIPHVAMARRL